MVLVVIRNVLFVARACSRSVHIGGLCLRLCVCARYVLYGPCTSLVELTTAAATVRSLFFFSGFSNFAWCIAYTPHRELFALYSYIVSWAHTDIVRQSRIRTRHRQSDEINPTHTTPHRGRKTHTTATERDRESEKATRGLSGSRFRLTVTETVAHCYR